MPDSRALGQPAMQLFVVAGQLAALAGQAGQHVRAGRDRLEELGPQPARIGVIPGAIDRAERMDQRAFDLLARRRAR